VILRVPVKVWDRSESRLDADDVVFTVGTAGAEFVEGDPSEDPTGFLPDGFASVGSVAEPVLDAVEEAGYDAADYADAGRSEAVLWATVEDDEDDLDVRVDED